LPTNFEINQTIRDRYKISKEDFVLYTLTRLSSSEKYKGYDIVIECLPELRKAIPNIKYVIAGKYDEGEKVRIDKLVNENDLQEIVVFAGFIKNEEVKDFYQMADLFIMPSKGEGFGIVFIEAMACGLPVIAGNEDGSVDALQNGKLGTLVEPENENDIIASMIKIYDAKLKSTSSNNSLLQKNVLNTFGFDHYKSNLKTLLANTN
jgi:glycosyltransferase involved in cell wall biosynthesis